MIKSLVISIAELNEQLKDFLIDFFLKLGMGIGMLVGGLTGGLVYLAIICFGIWLIYTVVRLIYEGLGKPSETIGSKMFVGLEKIGDFWLWLFMIIIIATITFWLN